MIREELDKLDERKKRILMYAFENNLSQIIKIDERRFIGVNLNNQLKNIKINEQVGVWTLGEVK